MTGKEALKQLEERYQKFIIEWYYMSNMSKEERSRLFYMYDEEIKAIHIALEEFDKYKRAFEILKYNLEITKTNNIFNQPIIEISCNMFVTPEQGELLEELMKDEK